MWSPNHKLTNITDMSDERSVRIDKWLWSIRAYKTRSLAAEACKSNKITVEGVVAKPSREVKAGDIVTVKRPPVVYTFRVLTPLGSRVSAKDVPLHAENLTPEEELLKLTVKVMPTLARDRGTGRPTKKERREIDSLMDDFFDEDDEDI